MANLYNEWLARYEGVKRYCLWEDACTFVKANPSTANMRKGGPLGNTLLHQAAFWSVNEGVLETMKLCGADPNLHNQDGHTPGEMSEDPSFALRVKKVFGEDDAEEREHLLDYAKSGNLAQAFRILGERPYLVNTQTPNGWSVLHYAAYHGVNQRVLSRLVDLGASPEMRNGNGLTLRWHQLNYLDFVTLKDELMNVPQIMTTAEFQKRSRCFFVF